MERLKLIIQFWINLAIVCNLLSSCEQKIKNKNTIILNKENDSIQTIWKKDSLGCENKRTIAMGEKLYEQVRNSKDTILLKQIFGNPNKRIILENGEIVFIYYINYINSCCKEGKIHIEDCDYSFISFTISNKKNIIFGKGIL